MADEMQRIFNLLQNSTKAIADCDIWRYFYALLRGISNIHLTIKYLFLYKILKQQLVQV